MGIVHPGGAFEVSTTSIQVIHVVVAWLHQYMAFVAGSVNVFQRASQREYINMRVASAMY